MNPTAHFKNSAASILRTQRLLSGMSPVFRAGSGRPSEGKANAEALERFLNPPLIGRPPLFVVQDKHQLKFQFA